jgi:error-prone DNA polymerase
MLTTQHSNNPQCEFAELHCTSAFTFLTGASQPEELVRQAHSLGYRALALTDECSFAGIVRAHQEAKECGIKLIVGSRFYVHLAATESGSAETAANLILLARNKAAYSEISALITRSRRRAVKGEYQLHGSDLERISRCALAIWIPLYHTNDHAHGLYLKSLFSGRLWVSCSLHQQDHDGSRYHALYQLAESLNLPMVATNDVHMHKAVRQPLQDVLTAIRLKTPVAQLGKKRFPNAQRYLRPRSRLQEIYPLALLDESINIANLCEFSLDELRYQYPQETVPKGINVTDYLKSLVDQGALIRWPDGVPDSVITLLQSELSLIAELQYEYYFLTVHDIVAFARSRHILCQGRGSAANSAVCYCLFITEVDPSRSQLLFERFISRERNEAPDIDVDFEHERREEVMQYIYTKYGREHAALTATVIRYRKRSAVRDVGRALGIDESKISLLSTQLAWWDNPDTLSERFAEAGLHNSYIIRLYIQLVLEIIGFPRHLSQHVGGFVITRDPIHTLVPVENASMPDRTIIQWDKDDLEAVGLMKVDILALGMLTAIRKMLAIINEHRDSPLCIQDIPAEDPDTYNMLCKGDSVGVFQVESRAQMNMLPRLKPRTFYDLVIEVAIVRPGPIQGDMVHPFLRRRNGLEKVEYPDKRIEKVLSRTLGIPIFQEQVIQLVMVAAGFSGGQADRLRRAMASWGKTGELSQFRDPIINGMFENGYSQPWAERLFEMMKGFGGYGFPESHSASFALLVYLSAWLKRHHTSAFYVGLLNSLPMGFYSPSQLIHDARRHGIDVQAVDIQHSAWDYSLEKSRVKDRQKHLAIRIGFRQIKGFNQEAAERITVARKASPFLSLEDIYQRCQLSRQERRVLIDADALKSISGHRHQSHWQDQGVQEVRPLFQYESTHRTKLNESKQENEIINDDVRLTPPSDMDTMLCDYRRLGLTLGKHPMALLRNSPEFHRCLTARQLRTARHGQLAQVAGLVTNRQRPGSASGALFVTLEDESGCINVIIWESLQKKFRREILTGTILLIKGTLEKSDEGVVHLIAGYISDQSNMVDALKISSRDFH